MVVCTSSIPSVFIIRHGERLDHKNKLWQPDPALGICDPPITAEGFQQAEKTGLTLIEMMKNQNIDIKNTTLVIYTSPFQRCVNTSIGILKGIQKSGTILKNTPILRLDLGLGEWMCERFFDQVCPSSQLISLQQETLARQQAYTYSMVAKNKEDRPDLLLPPITIDYAYTNSTLTEFDYPERYTNMLRRFEKTRLNCLENANFLNKPNDKQNHQSSVVVIFVTHAVGVNALLDGFRNRVTIPLESSYCSISCVRQYSNSLKILNDTTSDQSDEEAGVDYGEYMETNKMNQGYSSPSLKSKWFIEAAMSDAHLLL